MACKAAVLRCEPDFVILVAIHLDERWQREIVRWNRTFFAICCSCCAECGAV